jgi:hypothetical protein
MRKETHLDKLISQRLLEQNDTERANHVSSGKLSASMLGQPLQWQILKVIGVPAKPFDEYTLRKFKRGKDIENWFISEVSPNFKQPFVEYRSTVGYVDLILTQNESFDFPLGIVPHEVKSVANAKYKRIGKAGEADRSHKLQATLYALAKNSDYYAIDYIASDDLRIETWIYETKDTKGEVDDIITKFQEQLKLKVVPVFEEIEAWQKNPIYQNYPEWATLTAEECMNKLKSEFPDAFNKLTN